MNKESTMRREQNKEASWGKPKKRKERREGNMKKGVEEKQKEEKET